MCHHYVSAMDTREIVVLRRLLPFSPASQGFPASPPRDKDTRGQHCSFGRGATGTCERHKEMHQKTLTNSASTISSSSRS